MLLNMRVSWNEFVLTVGVNNGSRVDFVPDYTIHDLFQAGRNEFCEYKPAAFEQAKHNYFADCPVAPFAAHPQQAKVTFVQFHGPPSFAVTGTRSASDGAQASTRRWKYAKARDLGPVRGRQL